MAAISAFPSLLSCRVCRGAYSSSSLSHPLSPASIQFPSLRLDSNKRWKWNPIAASAVAEGETLIPEEAAAEEEGKEPAPAEQPVSVPVSPSDMLTMFFRAEGMMDESAVPAVSKALQETEGVGDLKVHIAEGIASVELTKQTTVQATGVASSLVEIIQGSGFKLQALNLSFEDEEDAVN